MDQLFAQIEKDFVSGRLRDAEIKALHAETGLAHTGSEWMDKFNLQHAKICLYEGNIAGALKLLEATPNTLATPDERAATRSTLLAFVYIERNDLSAARQALADAERHSHEPTSRASILVARGHMDEDMGRLEDAERSYTLSLANATAATDPFLQAQAMLNLGVVSLRQEHYEDALHRFDRASELAQSVGAQLVAEKALGNVGFSNYKLGDFRSALTAAQAAEKEAEQLGSLTDQAGLLTDIGLDQFRLHDSAAARHSYQQSYRIARSIDNFNEIVDAQVALGFLSIQDGDLSAALEHAAEANGLANRHLDQTQRFQPALLQAWVLLKLKRFDEANAQFLTLQQQGAPKASDRWKVENALAELAAARGDAAQADGWFEQAIATFNLQRGSISELKAKIPFLENGSDLYLGYMEQLIREGRINEALSTFDKSRAVTLTEGLGLTRTQPGTVRAGLSPTALAQHLDGTILVYCLRPETSYLWAIAPSQFALFRLPGKATILPLLESHNSAIVHDKDLLADASTSGRALYDLLIAPAQSLIPAQSRVFVIGDEALHGLNFETLIAPATGAVAGSQPHFWIDDATITNSASLSLLAAGGQRPPAARNVLLIGDPIPGSQAEVRLPGAPREIAEVAGRFAAASRTLLTGAQATPTAYESSNPGRFSFIHFVAHGTASETSPLDSAIILSSTPGVAASNRLYARTILDHRISAELVTLSTCYGSGKVYSGEGLVGLAWAFLRAGAHNVIASLWEISDATTPRLMDDLYRQLGEGASPSVALRAAKLAMLHSSDISHKPMYWAPFQLYSGA